MSKKLRIAAAIGLLFLVASVASTLMMRRNGISQTRAVEIATAHMMENERSVDISYGVRSVNFLEDATAFNGEQKGMWTVTFGVPSPPDYSGRIISRHVRVDKYGKVHLPSITTSP